jgi:uncharacterized tellurite resistance protein B-like protein
MSLLESLYATLRGGSPRMREAGLQPDETETVRKIVEALDELPAEKARYIATFAYILGRVANADLQISKRETAAMERIVVERGGLPPEQAVVVVQIAKTQNRLFGGTEDFLVTREFNELADRTQKLALLDCLYAVSASDETVSTLEDNEIGKVASELNLDRGDLVRARESYRQYLAVLKELDSGAPPDIAE